MSLSHSPIIFYNSSPLAKALKRRGKIVLAQQSSPFPLEICDDAGQQQQSSQAQHRSGEKKERAYINLLGSAVDSTGAA